MPASCSGTGREGKVQAPELMRRHAPKALIIAAAVAVLLPLAATPGILFTLDGVMRGSSQGLQETYYGFTATTWGAILSWKLANTLLVEAVGIKAAQYLMLFGILLLSGISMYRLSGMFTSSETARLYASLLYMLNPFTYIRLLVGHWYILAAYAALPMAVRSFHELLLGRRRKAYELAIVMSIVAISSHILLTALIILTITALLNIKRLIIRETACTVIRALVLFLLLNAYWLVPALTEEPGKNIISQISGADIVNFSPRVEAFNPLITIASMHGFWRGGYLYTKDLLPWWWVLFLIILFLFLLGLTVALRRAEQRPLALSFMAVWVTGLLLAAGAAGPASPAFEYLFQKFQVFRGMRDTHKFVAMLALAYSCLGALGVGEVEKARKTAARLLLLIPLLYSLAFFTGFAGQLVPTDYPEDWYRVNELLTSDGDDFSVLFFPWHSHMDLSWIENRDRRILNPAKAFFQKPVISASLLEVPGKLIQVDTPVQRYILSLLEHNESITNFGELVSVLGVKYVLLTKEADYEAYGFLFNQSDLKLVKETEHFYVFRNLRYLPELYSTPSAACAANQEELIELSRRVELGERVVLSEKCGYAGSGGVRYRKLSPVWYRIEAYPGYVVLAKEYSPHWRLSDRAPLEAYGAVNAWRVERHGWFDLRYERFYSTYLPSYFVSLTAILFVLLRLLPAKA